MDASPENASPAPRRRTSHLRTGRVSLPGCRYFVTAVTKDRVPALAPPAIAQHLCDTLKRLHESGDCSVLAATVMPDHVHLVIELGARLSIGRVCAKFKSLARDLGRAPWHWQQDQFEHRLRPNDNLEHFGFYVFMNPYRAGLVDSGQIWPWWICPAPERFDFLQACRSNGAPQPEWLGLCDRLTKGLAVGE